MLHQSTPRSSVAHSVVANSPVNLGYVSEWVNQNQNQNQNQNISVSNSVIQSPIPNQMLNQTQNQPQIQTQNNTIDTETRIRATSYSDSVMSNSLVNYDIEEIKNKNLVSSSSNISNFDTSNDSLLGMHNVFGNVNYNQPILNM